MKRITTVIATPLAALVLASCGGDDGEPIPSRDASQLESLLQAVQRQSDAGACDQLQDTTLPRLQREARRLPDSVSADTRETIEDGVAHLRDLAQEDCADQRDDQDQTTTTDETTAPTTTAPPTTTETTPDTTTTEDPTTTETQPPPDPTTPPEMTPPPDTTSPPDNPSNGTGGTPPGLERKGKKEKADGKKGGKG
jgi:hypothetical protein